MMSHCIWIVIPLIAGLPAYAAPPSDSTGQLHDWFGGLTVPGSSGLACCSVADCRMVDSRWNDQTRHFEAKVTRDLFGNVRRPASDEGEFGADKNARYVWMWNWISKFGEKSEVWIEVPEAKVSDVVNPTGHAVLCWSAFHPDSNGVFCFIPYQGT